jgi:hypothetical protein
VAVFDLAAVKDPSDFVKPHQYAEGFRHVIVNGRPAMLEKVMTGEKPGEVLYGPAKARKP